MKQNKTGQQPKKQKESRSYIFFAVSFFATLALAGIAGTAVVAHMQTAKKRTMVSSAAAALAQSSHTQGNLSFTLFLAVEDASTGAPSEFAAIRLDTARGRLVYTIVPLELQVTGAGRHSTLSSLYVQDGIQTAVAAFSGATRIPVDYSGKMRLPDLSAVTDQLGGVVFNVPFAMSAKSSSGSAVNLSPGSQKLDGSQVTAVFNFADYPGGNLQRYQVLGSLLKAFLQQKLSADYLKSGSGTAAHLLGLMQTNFTQKDFDARINTFKQISRNNIGFVQSPLLQINPLVEEQTGYLRYDASCSDQFFTYFAAQ